MTRHDEALHLSSLRESGLLARNGASTMMIVGKPSPNFGHRPAGVTPNLIVLHGTAGSTDAGDVAWCRLSQAELDAKYGPGKYAAHSYHYIVGRDGVVTQLVDETKRAWHAGVSSWNGVPNCNDYSIGIAASNRGDGELYTPEQYTAFAELSVIVMRRWSIPLERVVGHQHVSPRRKSDPWLTFDWMRFASRVLDLALSPIVRRSAA